MYASKTTRGFYDTAIHGDNMPADVVEITDEKHAALMEGQSNGKLIDFDDSGYPFLADPAPPTTEQMTQQIRAERDAKIEAVRWRIERAKDEEALGVPLTEPLEPLLQYVQALRDVPAQDGFPENVEWPPEP